MSAHAAPGATSREAQCTDTVKQGVNCKHKDHDASIERTTQPTGNSECIPVSRLQMGAFPEPAVHLFVSPPKHRSAAFPSSTAPGTSDDIPTHRQRAEQLPGTS